MKPTHQTCTVRIHVKQYTWMFCSSRSTSDAPKEVYESCSLFFQLMDSFLFDIEVKTAQFKDAGMQSAQRNSVEEVWGTEAEEGEVGDTLESGEEEAEEMEGDQTSADFLAEVDLEGLREIRSLSIPADWVSSEIMEDDSNLLQLLSDTIKVHIHALIKLISIHPPSVP